MRFPWAKVRVGLFDCRKITLGARHLRQSEGFAAWMAANPDEVSRNVTATLFVRVWMGAREDGELIDDDLFLRGMTVGDLDTYAKVPGVGAAMAAVGWAEEVPATPDRPAGVILPGFKEWNPPRSDAERKRDSRAGRGTGGSASRKCHGDVTGAAVTGCDSGVTNVTQIEEGRRKKEDSNPPTPFQGEVGGGSAQGQRQPAKAKKAKPPKAEMPPEQWERFARFWGAYPRHEAKLDAERAWAKLSPDEATLELILTAVERWKESEPWTREDGRFIPHPASWLNGRRWGDELKPTSQAGHRRARVAVNDDEDTGAGLFGAPAAPEGGR